MSQPTSQAPSSLRPALRKIPKRFTPVVFAFYMAGIMAFLMCASVAVVALNLAADIAVHALDPRVRSRA